MAVIAVLNTSLRPATKLIVRLNIAVKRFNAKTLRIVTAIDLVSLFRRVTENTLGMTVVIFRIYSPILLATICGLSGRDTRLIHKAPNLRTDIVADLSVATARIRYTTRLAENCRDITVDTRRMKDNTLRLTIGVGVR